MYTKTSITLGLLAITVLTLTALDKNKNQENTLGALTYQSFSLPTQLTQNQNNG